MEEPRQRYDCKQNDCHIYFNMVDGQIDELEIGDPLELEWIVIGFQDLVEALNELGYECGVKGQ